MKGFVNWCVVGLIALVVLAPRVARADTGKTLVTVSTVSAFPEPSISATAAIEIARLASERGWKGKLADRELRRMDRLVRDALKTSLTLMDQAVTKHKANADLAKRLATARENVVAAQALINPDTSKTVWRKVASEIEKASLLGHGAAKLVDKRAVTMVQMAVVQAMIGTNGIAALVGEKGMEGVVALLGAEGIVAPDMLIGTSGMVAKIAIDAKAVDPKAADALEAARKKVNVKAPAPTLSAQLKDVATANSALIVKFSAAVSLQPAPTGSQPTIVAPPPIKK